MASGPIDNFSHYEVLWYCGRPIVRAWYYAGNGPLYMGTNA